MSDQKFESDSFYTAILIGTIIGAIIALFYYFPILWKGPWACYRILQFYILDLFTFAMNAESESYIKSAINSLENKPWSQLNAAAIVNISRDMLYRFDLFLMLLLLYPCWKLSSRPRYKRQLNLDGLIEELSLTFKFASWLTKINPSKHALSKRIDEVSKKEVVTLDAAKGPWGLRKRIYDYCQEASAIKVITCPNTGESYEYLDIGTLHKKMSLQLGRKFSGWDKLKFYERWIAAALMTSLHSKKLGDEHSRMYDTMLGEASRYFGGLTSASKVDKLAYTLIEKYSVVESVKRIENSHFFVKTVIRELFHQSKAKGIRPHFHFGWLWKYDRTLALTLAETGPPDIRGNGVEVMFSESAIECLYVRTHWLAEKNIGYPLKEIEGKYILPEIEKDLIYRYDLISEERAASIVG